MLKLIAFFLYIYSGQIVLEQHPTKELEDCKAKLYSRAEELHSDPKFDDIIVAGCAHAKVTEASNAH